MNHFIRLAYGCLMVLERNLGRPGDMEGYWGGVQVFNSTKDCRKEWGSKGG
jgi:hypothetical protein